MAKEIERKFRVRGEPWREGVPGVRFRQGYLSSHPERTVRVRTDGARGFLTIKGPTRGATRDEFEYPIPLAEATSMLDHLCERPLIEKSRYPIVHEGMTWEIDVFEGENQGLVVAEVELPSEDHPLTLPPWVAEEVTHDPRFFNANLVRKPYLSW